MECSRYSLDEGLISAWRQAASELGFRLEAPYRFVDGQNEDVWVEGFLPDFGGKFGMIFTTLDREPVSTELFQSSISDTYREYTKDRFVEALADWGWQGPAQEQPAWLLPKDSS